MKKLLLTTAAATFSVAFAAPAANARSLKDEIVRQSHRIESTAGTLRNEFRVHFRHTAEFGHLMSDAFTIARRADAIHEIAHRIHCINDVHRLENALEVLDRQVHHLADLVEEATHGHGGGHVDGDIRHVFGLVRELTNGVHLMEDYVEALEAFYHRPAPVHPHHGHDDHGHGDHDHGHDDHGHGDHDHSHGHRDIRAEIIRGVLDRVLDHAGHGH